jgi:hypothetical protein
MTAGESVTEALKVKFLGPGWARGPGPGCDSERAPFWVTVPAIDSESGALNRDSAGGSESSTSKSR